MVLAHSDGLSAMCSSSRTLEPGQHNGGGNSQIRLERLSSIGTAIWGQKPCVTQHGMEVSRWPGRCWVEKTRLFMLPLEPRFSVVAQQMRPRSSSNTASS